MRRIKTTVTSNGATLYTMTHHNKIHTSHEKGMRTVVISGGNAN